MADMTETWAPVGAPVNISASTTSASGTLVVKQNSPVGGSIRIVNNSSAAAYLRWGAAGQTAVTTDLCMLASSVETFAVDVFPAEVAVILASGTGTVQVTPGQGF